MGNLNTNIDMKTEIGDIDVENEFLYTINNLTIQEIRDLR